MNILLQFAIFILFVFALAILCTLISEVSSRLDIRKNRTYGRTMRAVEELVAKSIEDSINEGNEQKLKDIIN